MLIKSPSPSLQGRHPIVSRVAKPPFGRAGSSRTPWNVIRNRDINFVLTPVTVRNRDCTDVTPTANYASYAKMLWSPLVENLQRIEKGRSFVLLCLGKGWVESGRRGASNDRFVVKLGIVQGGCCASVTGPHSLRENPWLPRVSVTGCDRCVVATRWFRDENVEEEMINSRGGDERKQG